MNLLVKHTRIFCITSKLINSPLPKWCSFTLLERSSSSSNFGSKLLLEHISRRCFASKKDEVFKLELPRNDTTDKKEPKFRSKTQDYKQKIYLKDISGRMLGLKTRDEARLIAKHHRLILVEDDTTKKIPTFKLANPRDIDEIGDLDLEEVDNPSSSSSSSSDSTSDSESHSEVEDNRTKSAPKSRSTHPKHMMFTSKLTPHDLQVKIKHVKKWVAKGHETIVKVNAIGPGDSAKLEYIDKEFDRIFNHPATCGTKINQHRLTPRELKLNVVPVDLKLIAKSLEADGIMLDDVVDLDKIDPNQLLNDENILKKITSRDDSNKSKNKKN